MNGLGRLLRGEMKSATLAGSLVLLLAAQVCDAASVSVEGADLKLNLKGEVRVRVHDYHDAGTDDGVANASSYVSQRTRFGAAAAVGNAGNIFIQLQDVRRWGEETDTNRDFSAAGLDLHQGYGELCLPGPVRILAGRQEISIENQRLVGPVGWSDQGRSFDAVRLIHAGPRIDGDAFYALVQDPDSILAPAYRHDFYGAHARVRGLGPVTFAGVYFYEDDRNASLFRHTFGTIADLKVLGLKAGGEFYWQAGRTGGAGIEAFMASAGAGWDHEFGSVEFGFYGSGDVLSGDRAIGTGNYRVFNTLYATNHKFYGFMDNFTSFPSHTGGLGLVDIMGRAHVSRGLLGRTVKLTADYHKFRLAADTASGIDDLGHEVDGTLIVAVASGIKVQVGYSTFWPEIVRKSSGRTAREEWSYLMTSWVF